MKTLIRGQLSTNKIAQFLSVGLILGSILSAGNAHAEDLGSQLVAADLNPECSQYPGEPADRFESPMKYREASKVFANLCINTRKFRPGIILQENADRIIVANYLHEGEFWKAEINTTAAAWLRGYFHIVRFPIVKGIEAAHTQLRFVSTPGYPIRLTSQKTGRVTTVSDLIFSVEAALPKDKQYNFALGAYENYAIVGRLVSGTQRFSENKDNATEQYSLKISQSETALLVRNALKATHAMSMNKFYSTIRPNCTTEAFDLLDTLPKLADKFPPFNTVLWIDPIAAPSIKALIKRDLIEKEYTNTQMIANGTLGTRYADLGDDVIKKMKAPPAIAIKSQELGIIREIPGFPYALVTIFPKQKNSELITKEIFEKLQNIISTALPHLAQAAIVSGILKQNVPDVLSSIMSGVHSEFRTFMREVNNELTDEPIYITSYLVPWGKNAKQLTAKINGREADLPFNGDTFFQANTHVSQDNFAKVVQNMRVQNLRSHRRPGTSPIYFIGAGIRLELRRNQSEQILQLALGWNPQNLPFSTNPAQVVFDQIHLPTPSFTKQRIEKTIAACVEFTGTRGACDTEREALRWLKSSSRGQEILARHLRTEDPKQSMDLLTNELGAVLITHTQGHLEKFSPKLHFDFGSLGRINDSIGYKKMGLLTVEKYVMEKATPLLGPVPGFGMCVAREHAVPEMRGRILKNASGIAKLDAKLEDKKIALGFYEFDIMYTGSICKNSSQYSYSKEQEALCKLDEESETGIVLTNVDVRARINLGGNTQFGCVRQKMMTDQFTSEANASIDYQIGEFIKANKKKLVDSVFGG